MASAELFAPYPSFPEDVPTADIAKISLSKLNKGNEVEAQEVYHECRTKGVFLLDLQNDPDGERLLGDIKALYSIVSKVMSLDLEQKIRYSQEPPLNLLGYKAKGVTKNEKGVSDWCEWYNLSRDDILEKIPRRSNPGPIEDNRDTFASFFKDASPIIQRILEILDARLGLTRGTLYSLQSTDRPSNSIIRMIRYPPQPPGDHGSSLVGHTDYGSITLLSCVLGGLQTLPPGASNEDAHWQYVKPEPNCVIVNLGDAMVEWSGDILRSNEHRVVSPPGKQTEYERFSIAYLLRPVRSVSMNRLVGGIIPSAAQDDKEDLSMSAEEWEAKKAMALKNGEDCARSRGGREI